MRDKLKVHVSYDKFKMLFMVPAGRLTVRIPQQKTKCTSRQYVPPYYTMEIETALAYPTLLRIGVVSPDARNIWGSQIFLAVATNDRRLHR